MATSVFLGWFHAWSPPIFFQAQSLLRLRRSIDEIYLFLGPKRWLGLNTGPDDGEGLKGEQKLVDGAHDFVIIFGRDYLPTRGVIYTPGAGWLLSL